MNVYVIEQSGVSVAQLGVHPCEGWLLFVYALLIAMID